MVVSVWYVEEPEQQRTLRQVGHVAHEHAELDGSRSERAACARPGRAAQWFHAAEWRAPGASFWLQSCRTNLWGTRQEVGKPFGRLFLAKDVPEIVKYSREE